MDNIKKFKESDLPQDSRDIINVIKKTYLDISKDKLNVEQQLELENLFNKRFPQIIEEYILISPRYKEKLISHNESPDQLLLDSLTEIQNKINVLFELQETGKHNKMKVSNRYLKKI